MMKNVEVWVGTQSWHLQSAIECITSFYLTILMPSEKPEKLQCRDYRRLAQNTPISAFQIRKAELQIPRLSS